tara:strand:- start:1689 stop:2429 length:741 start_codon:yes stop_codon:yes gene_type:complete
MTISIVDNMTKQKAIKELFKKSGYNISQFARAVGFTRNQVYAWFNGRADIRENNLEMIANRLNYKVDWLGSNRLELIKGEDMFGNTQDKQTIDNQNELITLLREQLDYYKDKCESLEDSILNNQEFIPELNQSEKQAIICLDKKIILSATNKYAELLGYQHIEMLGLDYIKIVHEDEYPKMQEAEQLDKLKGYVNQGIWKMKKKDKGIIYIFVDSNFIGNNKIFLKITESNKKEYLKQNEDTETKA